MCIQTLNQLKCPSDSNCSVIFNASAVSCSESKSHNVNKNCECIWVAHCIANMTLLKQLSNPVSYRNVPQLSIIENSTNGSLFNNSAFSSSYDVVDSELSLLNKAEFTSTDQEGCLRYKDVEQLQSTDSNAAAADSSVETQVNYPISTPIALPVDLKHSVPSVGAAASLLSSLGSSVLPADKQSVYQMLVDRLVKLELNQAIHEVCSHS